MNNPAFELIRRHKDVSYETESLVLKQIKNKVSSSELMSIFEDGISGKYGKLYSCDPQTLIKWVDEYLKTKNSPINYLNTGLIPVTTDKNETIDWDKEANKCYSAFVSGVHHNQFHPGVYDRLMLDAKIDMNDYLKYYTGPESSRVDEIIKSIPVDEKLNSNDKWRNVIDCVNEAKQKSLSVLFNSYRSKGYSVVYFIKL